MFLIRSIDCNCVLLPSQGHRRLRLRRRLPMCTSVTCVWADLLYNSRSCKSWQMCVNMKVQTYRRFFQAPLRRFKRHVLADKMTRTAKLPLKRVHVTIFFGNTLVYNVCDCVPVFPCENVSNVYVLGTVSFLLCSSACFIRSWYSIRTRSLRPCQTR